MKLLVLTQAVDSQDPYTSFFGGWLSALANHFESINVICLKEGPHSLPPTVRVWGLGKSAAAPAPEGTAGRLRLRLRYIVRLYRHLWRIRGEYDAVFVHMNQEYILVAGVLWLLLGKPIYLWRNHYMGGFGVDVAAAFCTKVFCTSRFSFTAKYEKTTLMPVGVDTTLYRPLPNITRVDNSVLFWGRMSPSKRPEMLVDAFSNLSMHGIGYRASLYGSPLPKDEEYYEHVVARAKASAAAGSISFSPGRPHSDGPAIFCAHEIFVNLSRSGMYDKTIYEAAACGLLVLAASKDFAEHVDPQFVFNEDGSDLDEKLAVLLQLPPETKEKYRSEFLRLADTQSLSTLGLKIAEELGAK